MIKIEQLNYSIDNRRIIDNLNLEADRGITCLLGESGCGKTTLLRLIAGLIKPESGKIVSSGKVGVLFQEDRLFPWLTAEQNVDMLMEGEEKEKSERAREYLELVSLQEAAELSPSQLSGGMQRRVSFAAMLAYNADVCLLDEPIRGLDEKSALVMREQIKALGQVKTVLMVTHSMSEALSLTDRIFIMENGCLRTLGK